jgi:hypothetical protein
MGKIRYWKFELPQELIGRVINIHDFSHSGIAIFEYTTDSEEEDGGVLIVNTDEEIACIKNSEIFYVSARKGKSIITMKDGEKMLNMPLCDLDELLDKRVFQRIGRDCIVNINAIAEYGYHLVKMVDEQVLPIRKTFKSECRKRLGEPDKVVKYVK